MTEPATFAAHPGAVRTVVRKGCATCRHAVVNSNSETGPREENRLDSLSSADNCANRCRWCIRLFEDRWEPLDGEIGFEI